MQYIFRCHKDTLDTVQKQDGIINKNTPGTFVEMVHWTQYTQQCYNEKTNIFTAGEAMAISEARHKANEKYNAKAYDDIKVRVQKGQKEQIQAAASRQGQSLNAYIVGAVNERMEREQPEEQVQEHSSPSILEVMRQMAASGKSAVELTQESSAASAQDTHRGDNSIISPEEETDMAKVDLPF